MMLPFLGRFMPDSSRVRLLRPLRTRIPQANIDHKRIFLSLGPALGPSQPFLHRFQMALAPLLLQISENNTGVLGKILNLFD